MSHELNSEQATAVNAIEGPVLLMAGAGAGKTRVLTHRAKKILSGGEKLIFATFTNKAAGEMRSRLSEMVGADLIRKRAEVSTLHSFAWRLVIKPASNHDALDAIGRRGGLRIARLDERQGFKQLAWRALPKKLSTTLENNNASADTLASCMGVVSAFGLSADDIDEDIALRAAEQAGMDSPINQLCAEALPVFAAVYEKHAQESNVLDFDGVLVSAVRLLNAMPEVKGALRKTFPFVQVDEFQDTNLVQLQLVTQITGQDGNCCAVGDYRQSIYGFRGAGEGVFTQFLEQYPSTEVLELRSNYRSTRAIVSAANACARSMPAPKGVGGAGDMKSGKHRLRPPRPEWWRFNTDAAESVVLAQFIEESAKKKSVMLIYRSRFTKEAVEQALVTRGVEYEILEDKSFFEYPEVMWGLDLYRTVINPNQRFACIKTLGRLDVRISESKADELWDQEGGYAGLSASINNSRGRKPLKAFLAELDSLRAAVTEAENGAAFGLDKPGAMKKRLMSLWHEKLESQFEKKMASNKAFKDNPGELKVRVKNAEQRVDRLCDIIQRVWWRKRDLNYVLTHIELYGPQGGVDKERAAVVLSTVHSAKGLEADVVVFLGGGDQSQDVAAVSNEERRVFYVAITRPRDELIITSCRQRESLSEIHKMREDSPFMAELGDSVIVRDKREQGDSQFEGAQMREQMA